MKVLVRFFYFISLLPALSYAQETVVRGKVTDAGSGDPIPFVNVIFKGTGTGGTTDFDGNYVIRTIKPSDSVFVTYIGYKPKRKPIKRGITQVVNFQLDEDVTNLQEVVVKSGENPAFEILRGVIRNKERNDKRSLDAYEYDTYTKMEVDMDNISDKFRQKKVMKKIAQVLDSIDRIVGEDGKAILPLFITESVSKYYVKNNPELKSEHIIKSKISGVGLDDGTMVQQLVGSSFQEYNFYQNWVTIINKNFVSPIADGWRLYYDYDLLDSLYVGEDFCYRLDFFPKNPLELAFTGSMWITKKNYALKQIDASVGKEANVNFIDRIRIQQELSPTQLGPWIPHKNRVLINISEISKNSAGLLAKFYTSNQNVLVNVPKDPEFYERRIEVKEDAHVFEEEPFWDSLRHEPLTASEKNVYKMIDTLKNIPVVKTYTEIFKAIVDGYYSLGAVELGPYPRTAAWNSVEGLRIQGGFKTNIHFSRKMSYGGMLAYGFTDQRFKYMATTSRILNRNQWTTLTLRVKSDIIRLGIDEDALSTNPLFLTAARWGQFRRAYYFNELYAAIQRDVVRGLTMKGGFRYWTFNPTYACGFNENATDPNPPVYNHFQTAEFFAEARWARDETYIQNGNERISLGLRKWPAFSIRFTQGVKGLAGSDFTYHKYKVTFDKRIRMGTLGVGFLSVTGEYIPEKLPYALLTVHLGNQSPFYSQFTYNLMNFGEFVSDRSVSVRYRQFLEGFILNRIPLIQKLKWRFVATGNFIYGELHNGNQKLISESTPQGQPALKTGFFSGTPYVELGYGVENIFKFFRVDFVHRMTYLDNPDVRKFGVLVTAQFKL